MIIIIGLLCVVKLVWLYKLRNCFNFVQRWHILSSGFVFAVHMDSVILYPGQGSLA